jgi:arsenate reductase (thioredoxin)
MHLPTAGLRSKSWAEFVTPGAPEAVQGSEEERLRAFRRAHLHLSTRIRLFLSLPLEKLDRQSLQRQVQQLGKSP